jgi:hypothetical protein
MVAFQQRIAQLALVICLDAFFEKFFRNVFQRWFTWNSLLKRRENWKLRIHKKQSSLSLFTICGLVFLPHHTKNDIKECYKAVRASSSEQMKYNAQGKHSNTKIISLRAFCKCCNLIKRVLDSHCNRKLKLGWIIHVGYYEWTLKPTESPATEKRHKMWWFILLIRVKRFFLSFFIIFSSFSALGSCLNE